jgi:energy-coupling factor transporter ATP-binding protein EcfA2
MPEETVLETSSGIPDEHRRTTMNTPQKSAYQASMELADQHGLYEIDPQLRIMALQVGNTASTLAERVKAMFVQRVQAIIGGLEKNPFLPGPPAIISNGLFTLGTVAGVPFRLTPQELFRHVLAAGPSGSGKTTLLQPLALQFREAGGHLMVADYKADLEWLAVKDEDFLYLHENVPVNILDHSPYVSRSEFINMITTCLCRAAWGGEHLRQAVHETLWETYRRHEHPSINDWISVIDAITTPKDTYQRRDSLNGLRHRLARLVSSFPGMAQTRVGIAHNTLWEHSLYLGSLTQTDIDEFLTAWLVYSYYLWARSHQARNTARYLILLDEGLLSFGENNRIDGPVLLPLIPLLRELGAAVAVSTADLDHTHATLRANMYTTIVLPLANGTDATAARKTLSLNEAQTQHLLRLTTGQAVVRTGKWHSPLLLEFPALPYEKTTTAADRQAAIERTDQLAPRPTPIATIATPMPAPTPLPDKEPAAIALNKTEEALLHYVGQEGVTLVSHAYEALELHPQSGHRARKKLGDLGLLDAEQIVSRKGRGGTGTALSLTDAGNERHGKRTRQPRGGDGVQHRWILLQVCHAFSVAPDVVVGKKPIDIVIPYNKTNSEQLDRVIQSAHPVGKTPTITTGQVLGIEIETDYHATAENNATKNYEAGIKLTIIAVLKDVLGAVTHLQDKLTAEAQDHTMVADALDLLDIIRKETP